jgi:hypothetical protein
MKTEILNYGDNRTIHSSTKIQIEQDVEGNVVSVWFRCLTIPFEVVTVGEARGKEMLESTKRTNKDYKLHAVKMEIPTK